MDTNTDDGTPARQTGQVRFDQSDAVNSGDGNPRFGRLMLVLIVAVLLVLAITAGSQAYFTP